MEVSASADLPPVSWSSCSTFSSVHASVQCELFMCSITANKWCLLSADTSKEGGPRLVFDHQVCMCVIFTITIQLLHAFRCAMTVTQDCCMCWVARLLPLSCAVDFMRITQ